MLAAASAVRGTLAAAAGGMARAVPAPRADQLIVYALGASIAIHAVLLAIRFRPFDPTRSRGIARRRSRSRW